MTAPQNFRSAFNGFNREDVVHYLEYINSKHTSQVNQLTTENEELRGKLHDQPREDELRDLQDQCADLRDQLALAQARVEDLELELELAAAREVPAEPVVQVTPVVPSISEELETYRRAERIEREARERAELVYFQATGVLTEATAKVDGLAADITDMADKVMEQLTQLQMAVSSSKQALQDASSIMNTIRPNK